MLQYVVQFTCLYSATRQTSSQHSVHIKDKYCGMFILFNCNSPKRGKVYFTCNVLLVVTEQSLPLPLLTYFVLPRRKEFSCETGCVVKSEMYIL